MIKKDCDHKIGVLSSYNESWLTNLVDLVSHACSEFRYAQYLLKEPSYGMGFDSTKKRCRKMIKTGGMIFTGSPYMKRFQYCPECGKRLNWTVLRKDFAEKLKEAIIEDKREENENNNKV